MDIRTLQAGEYKCWDDFVDTSPQGTLFHKTGWMKAVEKIYGHKPYYLMALKDERVCGVLPLFQVRSILFGHSLVSVPYGVYGGIIADSSESHKMLREYAEALAQQLGVDCLELRTFEGVVNQQTDKTASSGGTESSSNKWIAKDLYVTFIREILPTTEENMQAIPRKQRAMVRKGEKSGLSSRVGGREDLAEFYKVYATNVRDLGTPVFPLSFFRSLMEEFPDTFILSVWQDGKMAAGVLTFVYRDALLPYYGGGLREYFDYAVNDFMYWELMKYGCENGFRFFDFGRSKKETGSYRFKKHWGFEPADLDYRYYLVKAQEMPDVNPLNPKYRLMINTWKRLPLPIANWLGPKIVRGIP